MTEDKADSGGQGVQPPPSFESIRQMTLSQYQVDIGWNNLENTLEFYEEGWGLELDPDFQRGHVWTEKQQIGYVEFILRNGQSGRDILFNCASWDCSPGKHPIQCVDGLQRLTAVRKFMGNEIKAFGYYLREYKEKRTDLMVARFRFHINILKTREEILQWYLDINTGGTVHTNAEIEKVLRLLKIERGEDVPRKPIQVPCPECDGEGTVPTNSGSYGCPNGCGLCHCGHMVGGHEYQEEGNGACDKDFCGCLKYRDSYLTVKREMIPMSFKDSMTAGKRMSLAEIKSMCFDLGLDFENIPSGEKWTMIFDLCDKGFDVSGWLKENRNDIFVDLVDNGHGA